MADQKHLSLLKESVEEFNQWRVANPTQQPDLSRANLTGANLTGANLSRAYLPEADLPEADLSRANLSRAYLSGAGMFGAYLSGANLTEAYMSGANLSRANLSRANLSRANLSRANLFRAYLFRADLSRADLSRANMTEASLTEASLTEADLFRANLTGAHLIGANLSRAYLSRANLGEADLSRANITGANLNRAKLGEADLSGADLSGANLTTSKLFGARWEPKRTPTWPRGFDPPSNHWGAERSALRTPNDPVGPATDPTTVLRLSVDVGPSAAPHHVAQGVDLLADTSLVIHSILPAFAESPPPVEERTGPIAVLTGAVDIPPFRVTAIRYENPVTMELVLQVVAAPSAVAAVRYLPRALTGAVREFASLIGNIKLDKQQQRTAMAQEQADEAEAVNRKRRAQNQAEAELKSLEARTVPELDLPSNAAEILTRGAERKVHARIVGIGPEE